MAKWIYLFTGLLIPFLANAQVHNEAFENRMRVSPIDSGKLYLGLNILGFGKNNEYSETIVDGYTLFGYQLSPYLSYSISSNLRLDAGVYLQQDFGNDNYSQVAPVFSLKYQKRNFSLIFGTLEGALNHQLIEPLYNFENVLNNRLEQGIQYILRKEGLFFDTWINWQNMIYWNDPDQEQFTAGISFRKTIYKKNDLEIELPVQGLARHRGGEIDSSPGLVSTLYNGAIGLNVQRKLSGALNTLGIKSFLTFYTDGSPNPNQVYKDGYGVYLNPYFVTRFNLTVMGSFWYAHEFISPQGGNLFPSSNEQFPSAGDPYRSFIMLRALYDVTLADNVILTMRAEPFYDTFSNSLLYSFGVYINFYDRFYLTNVRKDN